MADTAQNTGQFSKVIVTNAGKEMIAKSQNGQVLRFTRVALGDGLIENSDDPVNFTAVKNERLSADIAKFTNKGNGQFEIQFRVSNQTVETGFWHREIGVMAQIDEGEEQLYAYTTSGNKASFLYDKTTPIEERIVNMAFIIGNAANVQVVINSSVIYTTIDDVNDYIGTHNATAASHAAAFEQHNNDRAAHLPMVGATTAAAGQRGIVPAPAAGALDRFLCVDATWKKASMTTLELVNVIYPVGIIVSFAAEFNPNEAWTGTTWEQMEAGRVLISAGTYTENGETYTYTLGDKGGEAKHQLTVGEMPTHGHTAYTDTQGNHYHQHPGWYMGEGTRHQDGTSAIPQRGDQGWQSGTYTFSTNGAHSHNVSITNAGNDQYHNNLQPYIVTMLWQRTA